MPEATRTFWKGHLRLALVTIPVRLMTATRSDEQISFHQVDRKTKQRIRYLKVIPGGQEVNKDDIVSGYEVENGNYVLFEGDELDALKLESRHTIELSQFVDVNEIEPTYFDRPYYILPDGDIAEEGYRVIRDALREAGKVGIGQLTLRGKEHLVALSPLGDGMLLETMRYQSEIKAADDVFSKIGKGKLRDDMVKMAKSLIESRTEAFDPSQFKNHYAAALKELVQSKLKGGEAVAVGDEQAEPKGKVIDFMEALKRSVGSKASESAASSEKEEEAPSKETRAKAPRAAAPKRAGVAKSKTASSKTASKSSSGGRRKRASA